MIYFFYPFDCSLVSSLVSSVLSHFEVHRHHRNLAPFPSLCSRASLLISLGCLRSIYYTAFDPGSRALEATQVFAKDTHYYGECFEARRPFRSARCVDALGFALHQPQLLFWVSLESAAHSTRTHLFAPFLHGVREIRTVVLGSITATRGAGSLFAIMKLLLYCQVQSRRWRWGDWCWGIDRSWFVRAGMDRSELDSTRLDWSGQQGQGWLIGLACERKKGINDGRRQGCSAGLGLTSFFFPFVSALAGWLVGWNFDRTHAETLLLLSSTFLLLFIVFSSSFPVSHSPPIRLVFRSFSVSPFILHFFFFLFLSAFLLFSFSSFYSGPNNEWSIIWIRGLAWSGRSRVILLAGCLPTYLPPTYLPPTYPPTTSREGTKVLAFVCRLVGWLVGRCHCAGTDGG